MAGSTNVEIGLQLLLTDTKFNGVKWTTSAAWPYASILDEWSEGI